MSHGNSRSKAESLPETEKSKIQSSTRFLGKKQELVFSVSDENKEFFIRLLDVTALRKEIKRHKAFGVLTREQQKHKIAAPRYECVCVCYAFNIYSRELL